MELNEFSDACHTTNNYSQDAIDRGILFVGMAEESGEANGKFKRMVRDDGGKWTCDRKREAVMECMDTIWYAVENIRSLGYTFEEAASLLIYKLADRNARGVISGEGDKR